MAAPIVAGAFLLYEAESLVKLGRDCLSTNKNLYMAEGSEMAIKKKKIQFPILDLSKSIGYPTSCI